MPAEPTPEPDAGLAASVLALVAQRPDSTQPAIAHPSLAARKLSQQAAAKAAAAAGALALPPGPLGWLTILPEMLAVWRIQAQLVADIAALYGRSAELGQAQMLYCLFRHTAAQGLRDLVVRVGERVLVRPATTAVLKQIAASIGLKLSERALGKSVARWIPLVGAAGVSAYAWYDTQQVGKAALELFEREMVVEG
jgi:uncharacterized protein (DUF697 family)